MTLTAHPLASFRPVAGDVYERWCPDCGFRETSWMPDLLTAVRPCPRCGPHPTCLDLEAVGCPAVTQ